MKNNIVLKILIPVICIAVIVLLIILVPHFRAEETPSTDNQDVIENTTDIQTPPDNNITVDIDINTAPDNSDDADTTEEEEVRIPDEIIPDEEPEFEIDYEMPPVMIVYNPDADTNNDWHITKEEWQVYVDAHPADLNQDLCITEEEQAEYDGVELPEKEPDELVTTEPSAEPEPSVEPEPEDVPVVNPVEDESDEPSGPDESNTRVEQEAEQARQETKNNFTYPPNTTTEGLTASQIAQGKYIDKSDGAILDQEGNFCGYYAGWEPEDVGIDTEEEIEQGRKENEENAQKIYNGDGSGSDTSSFNH